MSIPPLRIVLVGGAVNISGDLLLESQCIRKQKVCKKACIPMKISQLASPLRILVGIVCAAGDLSTRREGCRVSCNSLPAPLLCLPITIIIDILIMILQKLSDLCAKGEDRILTPLFWQTWFCYKSNGAVEPEVPYLELLTRLNLTSAPQPSRCLHDRKKKKKTGSVEWYFYSS